MNAGTAATAAKSAAVNEPLTQAAVRCAPLAEPQAGFSQSYARRYSSATGGRRFLLVGRLQLARTNALLRRSRRMRDGCSLAFIGRAAPLRGVRPECRCSPHAHTRP